MSNIVPFNFDGASIRVLEIDGEPWFVGKDVAEALGYKDTTNAMKQHCKGWRNTTPFRPQEASRMCAFCPSPTCCA